MKRMIINLEPKTAKMLELLAELQEISEIEALRRAISAEAFLQTEIRKGSKILIMSENGKIEQYKLKDFDDHTQS